MNIRVNARVASSLPLIFAHRSFSSLLIAVSHPRSTMLLIIPGLEGGRQRWCIQGRMPALPQKLVFATPYHCSSLLLITAHHCSSSPLIAAPHHRSSLLLIIPGCDGGRRRELIQGWTPALVNVRVEARVASSLQLIIAHCCSSSLLIAAPHPRSSLLLLIPGFEGGRWRW